MISDITLNYNIYAVKHWTRAIFYVLIFIKLQKRDFVIINIFTRQSASFSLQPAYMYHLIFLSSRKTLSNHKTRIRAYRVARRLSLLPAQTPTISLLPLSVSAFATGSKTQWKIQGKEHALLK